MTSGLVCLLNPEEGYGIENPKRWRESREILKILKFQKDLKKKYPETLVRDLKEEARTSPIPVWDPKRYEDEK